MNDIAGVFDDPQVHARHMRMQIEHPVAGPLGLVGSPLRLSATPVSYDLPPPVLGQHTEEVLSELLGMPSEQLRELREAGVI